MSSSVVSSHYDQLGGVVRCLYRPEPMIEACLPLAHSCTRSWVYFSPENQKVSFSLLAIPFLNLALVRIQPCWKVCVLIRRGPLKPLLSIGSRKVWTLLATPFKPLIPSGFPHGRDPPLPRISPSCTSTLAPFLLIEYSASYLGVYIP